MASVQLSYQQCPTRAFSVENSKLVSSGGRVNVGLPVNLGNGNTVIITLTPRSSVGIDFYNAESNKDLNCLHTAIRFEKDSIDRKNELVFNFHTKLNQWDASTARVIATTPFALNTQYTVAYTCTPKEWIFSLNGKEYARYPTNIPCDKANHLTISGDAVVTSVVLLAA